MAANYLKKLPLTIKRSIDVIVALAIVFFLWPVMLATAILVYLRLGSPVFFKQTRIGKNERPFSIVKFRTMHAGDGEDAVRMTRLGAVLRATSLDELPEVWNLLTGEMSLVGPRPLFPEYLPFYTPRERLRHTVRPGITGLAQVSGRNAISWNDRLELDVKYIENWKLSDDFRILFRTIITVIRREGVSAEGHVTMQRLDDERGGHRHAL